MSTPSSRSAKNIKGKMLHRFSGRSAISFLFITAGWLSTAAAQQVPGAPPLSSIRSLPHDFLADEWQMWTSPFRRDSYTGHAVKKYVIPFALITTGLIASDRKISEALPNTSDQTTWSGRVSQLGAWYSMAGVSGGTYLIGALTKNDHARETGFLALEALGHTQVAVFGIKQFTNRQRPTDGDGRGGFWEGGNSFPSGHAASAFAVATVFSYEYRNYIAVPIAAYTMASLISVSRISGQKHWASDVFVAGATGFLIGRFIYKNHHDPNLPGSPVHRATRFVPEIDVVRSGASLSWRF